MVCDIRDKLCTSRFIKSKTVLAKPRCKPKEFLSGVGTWEGRLGWGLGWVFGVGAWCVGLEWGFGGGLGAGDWCRRLGWWLGVGDWGPESYQRQIIIHCRLRSPCNFLY